MRAPGNTRSISGTASEHAASDHSSPLVLNRRNCDVLAADTGDERREQHASRARIGRRLRIGNHEKREQQQRPLSRRCSGIVIGSPRYSDRPTISAP